MRSVNKLKQAPSGDNQQWSRNNFAMAATAATITLLVLVLVVLQTI
jgi:hypothetical protein